MSDPKIVSDILGLGKVGEKGLDVVHRFLGRLLGPATDEVGQLIADPVRRLRERRSARAKSVLEAAAFKIETQQIETRPIPDSVLIPLLEGASLGDDELLAEKWACLLVSASSDTDVPPSFVSILSELSPSEAKFLDRLKSLADEETILYERDRPKPRTDLTWTELKIVEVNRQFSKLKSFLDISDAQGILVATNLKRLGLISVQARRDTVQKCKLTEFGYRFVTACSGDMHKRIE